MEGAVRKEVGRKDDSIEEKERSRWAGLLERRREGRMRAKV